MKFDLTQPCSNCPFRNDIPSFLTRARVRELKQGLVDEQATFTCHKTNKIGDDEEVIEDENSQHCAGALILLEKLERPNQMMRISERLGMYDMRKLKMDSPVFNTFGQMIKAQER